MSLKIANNSTTDPFSSTDDCKIQISNLLLWVHLAENDWGLFQDLLCKSTDSAPIIMINITLHNANELISKLSILKQENFIFRGHSSGKYRLEPSAFRKDVLKKLADIHLSKTISKQWRSSNEVEDVIKWWGQGIPTQIISRVFDYIMHLMHYNFALNTVYLTKKDDKDINDQRLLSIFPEDYWLQEDTFVRFFQYLCMGLPYRWDIVDPKNETVV